jgi:hypothetical protein
MGQEESPVVVQRNGLHSVHKTILFCALMARFKQPQRLPINGKPSADVDDDNVRGTQDAPR